MAGVVWLRRDLRRADLPLLQAAASHDHRVAVTFVLDPVFWEPAGPVRQGWLAQNLLALRETYDGRLCLRLGDPAVVIPKLAAEVGAMSVNVSTETEPGGALRDAAVKAALAPQDVPWVETGSPYAVTPGRLHTAAGTEFKVFTPFARTWRQHGWLGPATEPAGLDLLDVASDPEAWSKVTRAARGRDLPTMPEPGETAALARWAHFLERSLESYGTHRDRPDLDGTSLMSPYLKFGVVHPRTLLADLTHGDHAGAERFITELAWREFYADVLHHHPESLEQDLRADMAGLAYDSDPERLAAWQQGRTGYPIVDAGMRQLLATGWMHNRVRMITASFLTKDLHHWWRDGARWFEQHLIDADLASNTHGWQWTAGTGTDAAPYFRVFNPTLQGRKFDPHADYIRRWVPELAHLDPESAHEPWRADAGYAQGYPARIVDHAQERTIALARYQARRPR